MFEEKIAQRILKWRKNEKMGPFEVQLNPTNRCNLKCRFCWLRDFDERSLNYEEIDTEKYEDIIEDCRKMDVHSIEITGGGEPMMRKDLPKLMEIIKNQNIFGRLVTNGTLFSRDLLEELIELRWDEIIFSLDAPTKEVNDYLRGKSFDRIVKAIRSLQVMKMDKNKQKPKVHIHTVLCNKNFHLLPQMFEFAYNLNCKNLLIEPITLLAKKTESGKDLLFEKKHKKALKKSIQEAIEVSYKHNFQTNLDELELELIENTSKMKRVIEKEGRKNEKDPWLSLPCYQPFYRMIIRPWGVVGPCCMFDNLGETVKEKSLKDIWFGKSFKQIREKMINKELPNFCSKCNPSQIQSNRKLRSVIKFLVNGETEIL